MTITIVAVCIVQDMSGALELIACLVTILALLLTENSKNLVHGFLPKFTKDTGIASQKPILISQTQGIAQRVNLVLALVHALLHLSIVRSPMALLIGIVHKGIGIGIKTNKFQLLKDDTLDKFGQFGIVLDIRDICPHLCTRISQPHGINVACDDKSLVTIGEHCGIQSVGETVLEHLPQLWRNCHQCLMHLLNLLLYSLAGKTAFLNRQAMIECVWCLDGHRYLLGNISCHCT